MDSKNVFEAWIDVNRVHFSRRVGWICGARHSKLELNAGTPLNQRPFLPGSLDDTT